MTASTLLFALSVIFFMMGVVMTFAPVRHRRWMWEGVAWIITFLLLWLGVWLVFIP
jgi:hypothetical protein